MGPESGKACPTKRAESVKPGNGPTHQPSPPPPLPCCSPAMAAALPMVCLGGGGGGGGMDLGTRKLVLGRSRRSGTCTRRASRSRSPSRRRGLRGVRRCHGRRPRAVTCQFRIEILCFLSSSAASTSLGKRAPAPPSLRFLFPPYVCEIVMTRSLGNWCCQCLGSSPNASP
uniref:Uncharacterized protein n=1 Tax=Oryza brachyantha TaxID=4533 RepID=J3LXS5_ORYBR